MASKYFSIEERRKKNLRASLLDAVKKDKAFKERKKFANFVTEVFSSSSEREETNNNETYRSTHEAWWIEIVNQHIVKVKDMPSQNPWDEKKREAVISISKAESSRLESFRSNQNY